MRAQTWVLLGVLLSLIPMVASASTSYTPTRAWQKGSQTTPTYSTALIACKGGQTRSDVDARQPTYGSDGLPNTYMCWMLANQPPTYSGSESYLGYNAILQKSCPYGGTLNAGQTLCTGAPVCPNNQVRNSTTGACEAPPCAVGQAATTRAWVGYAATQNNVSDWISPSLPTSTCTGTCSVGSLQIVSGSCTVSTTLGGPPYPGSCEFTGTMSGSTCSAQSGTAADTPPPIPCPTGTFAGSVNEVSGCYGGYQGSEVSQVTTNPDGSTTKTTTKIAPDGSTVTETVTTNADGSTTKTLDVITSTPASGGGALPGQGGTTGSTGGAAAGGTGDRGDTEQADFCRDNAASVMCQDKLKLDETGTPQSGDPLQGSRDGIEGALDGATQVMQGSSWRVSELPFVWSPSLPAGACSAWETGRGSIDLCPTMDKVRQLWGWVIYMIGMAALWALATRATGGGAK